MHSFFPVRSDPLQDSSNLVRNHSGLDQSIAVLRTRSAFEPALATLFLPSFWGTTMTLTIERVASSEVSRRFGYFYKQAMTRPIAIERHGAIGVVMLAASEYERLARLDHIALAPEELNDEQLNSIRTSRAPAEAIELNRLLADPPAD